MENSSSRKLQAQYEDPIDTFLIDLCDYFNPIFKRLNFTPNGITTLSLVTGLFSIYYLWKDSYVLASIFFILQYFFDCADGNYARKYKMTSKFGDLYDHIKDYLVFIGFMYVLYSKIKNRSIAFLLTVVLISSVYSVGMAIHYGCQEKYYEVNNPEKEGSEFLKVYKKLCVADNKQDIERNLKISRHFGSGNMYFAMIVFLLYLGYSKK